MTILSDDDLATLRGVAEGQMVDACTIARSTGTTTDPNTGAVVETYGSPFYSGPCTVKMLSGSGSDVHMMEQVATQTQLTVAVPSTSTAAQADDQVTITASSDPSIVGRKLRVESFYGQTWLVERRYLCEESTNPDE